MVVRKWRRADPVWQRRRLDEVRPDEAMPLQPSVAPPAFDAAFDDGPTVSGFDDLHDDRHPDPSAEPVEPQLFEVADSVPIRDDDQAAVAPPAPLDPLLASSRPEQQRFDLDVLAPTPLSITRPDELPEGELDPDVMAAALADLDAELARGHAIDNSSD
jgi:hypothetical protein